MNNHNYGAYIEQAIDSALSQGYDDVEVIVVDDGSTDDSQVRIRSYASRIDTLFTPNRGAAAACNAGFCRSTGDIIMFLDADDVLLPEAASMVVESFLLHSEASRIQFAMEVIDANGSRTGEYKPDPHVTISTGDLRDKVLAFPDDLIWMPTSANAFPAHALRTIMPIPEDRYGRTGADWYLSYLTPLFGPVDFLPRVGALYRVHGANSYGSHTLQLKRLHKTLQYMCVSHEYLREEACRLGFDKLPTDPLLVRSVSFIANRLISLRLGPAEHPIRSDTRTRLFLLGMLAAAGRFDVSMARRFLFALWFAATAAAPQEYTHWLAEVFLNSERRIPTRAVRTALRSTIQTPAE